MIVWVNGTSLDADAATRKARIDSALFDGIRAAAIRVPNARVPEPDR